MSNIQFEKALKDSGLSEQELAEKLGLGKRWRSTICDWKNGKQKIGDKTAALMGFIFSQYN